ncbi:auxilin-like protein 1 [Iris pallida]|uniref:Auxilin-like protein 1 n=1 Tax=Iris pallida TaxID=29817 RepID=A0AAX6HHW6_IRIPA|nr:auxilin-like protein 1 [Iris pallida]
MADHRNSRRAAASVYADVFGGPPKYSPAAPFAARSDDYGDIFGGMATSCSIPFLDLPSYSDGCDEPVDYSEIFGGFGGCDVAVDYEELFGKKKEEEKKPEVPFSNGRFPKETESGRRAKDTTDILGEGAFRENNQFPANSEYSDDGSRQFNMSFHKISSRSTDEALSGTTHVTQLHAVPGYTSVIDSCPPFQQIQAENTPNVVRDAHIHNITSKRVLLTHEEQVNIAPDFPGDFTKSSGADLKIHQKQFTDRCPAPEDAPAIVRHHSRSSSNHSSSSGDVSFPDVPYVTISDISLRTQPSRVPPPSRAPPKLVNKQGQPKMKTYGSFRTDLEEVSLPRTMGNRQTHYSLGVSKSHLTNKGVKDGSPGFGDVKIDASSAAAASAAAMKEAMEQAQARLKSAKELMERKRENRQNRKRMGQHEVMKCDERPEDKTVKEVKCFTDVKAPKTLLEEEGSMKELSFDERENIMRAAKAAPAEEKERYVVSSGGGREIMQGNGSKTPSVPYNLEEISGEWKMGKEFYELVKSEHNSIIVKEVYKQQAVEKNQKIANKVRQEELSCEFEMNGKSQKVEETSDRKENDESFTFGNMAFYEKIREIPNIILKACTGKENVSKLQEVHDSLQMENEKKLEAVQGAHVSEHELERINSIEGAVQGDYESQEAKKSAEFSCKSFEFDGVNGEEKETVLEAAEEPCGCLSNEKELEESSVSCVTLETEKRQNKVGGAGVQARNENETERTSQSCMLEVLEQLKAVDEANHCESHQEAKRDSESEYSHDKDGYKFEDTTSTLEEKSQGLNRVEEAGICLQNQVVEETNQYEAEDLEKFESVQGMLRQREYEKTTNSTEEAGMQDSEEKKTREADEKQQKAAQALLEQQNCEEAIIFEEGPKERETEKVGEVLMSSDFVEVHKRSDAARDIGQSAVDKEPEDVQQTSLLEKKVNVQNSVNYDTESPPVSSQSSSQDNNESCQVNSQSSAQDGTENCHNVSTENAIPDMHKQEKREHVKRFEKGEEQEKEQARNLEEEREREREREREKDRLAVERATREAHERAFAEARERAERIAVGRITAEARQRALAEAQEKAEKASAEALERSLAEKAAKEAKLRAERAAVERATAEARERAVERALAEKAASDARKRAGRLNAISRDSRVTDGENRETKQKPSFAGMQNVQYDARFQSASSSSSLKNTDSYIDGEVDSPLRCKARLERHQRTVERAAKALAEKNMRDILAQREQAERNRLAETLDAEVRRWSTGKEGNLRALLSTLQYILGPESGWQPVPLTDVITAVAVKKAYRKATLCVHPDKLQQRGSNIQQKYICEKVFDLLKEAWNRFNSEER